MTAGLGPIARRFLERQPFTPDRFQVEAITAVERGENVVVTAPTGSGKTLVAAAAVELALSRGRRAFYTTPIKALSNQKFQELRAVHDRVGLLTGDNVIDGDAPVVVMTTEVLRNMIYADAAALRDLGVVVLDEVHYLQDRYRGSVWEEVIIHLDRSVQLVCLSATIANPEEFTGWVAARRGGAALVVETHRPVPLESLYLVHDRYRGGEGRLFPVFDRHGRRPNLEVVKLLHKGRGRGRRFVTPRRLEVVERLQEEGLLPAIYFIFSRAGCEQAAALVAGSTLTLVDRDAVTEIRRLAEERTRHLAATDLAVLGHDGWLRQLERGVAAHHAGMVPAFKETVEVLFAAGLLRVVFATDTLALGINMPARAVVLESLSRFNGEHHELLRGGDYTQLTGRAGRRGIDTRGSAVVLHSPYVPFEKVADIAGAGSHPLVSSFQPSYNMVVNLVANYDRRHAEELLRASFARYREERRIAMLRTRVQDLEAEATALRTRAECAQGDGVAASTGRPDEYREAARAFARTSHPGDVLRLGGEEGRWLLLARGYGTSPRLLLLSEAGETRRVRAEELGAGTARVGRVDLPRPVRPREAPYRERAAARLRAAAEEPAGEPLPATVAGPVAACPHHAEHAAARRRLRRIEKDLARMRRRMRHGADELMGRYRGILGILERWGYVAGWSLTERGGRLRFIYNELDLLFTESVLRGHLAGLDPPALAALVSLFTYEARRGDRTVPPLSREVERRAAAIGAVWGELAAEEEAAGLPPSRQPDPGFAGLVHAWARGAELEELFGGDDFAAGDFVRNCRQLLDLLRQLRDAFPATASVASAAVRAVDRGVVALGGRV